MHRANTCRVIPISIWTRVRLTLSHPPIILPLLGKSSQEIYTLVYVLNLAEQNILPHYIINMYFNPVARQYFPLIKAGMDHLEFLYCTCTQC
jgi:hypothetical protein